MNRFRLLTFSIIMLVMMSGCDKSHPESIPLAFSATPKTSESVMDTKAGWTTIGKDDLTKYSFGIFGGYSATEGGTLTNLFDSDKAVKVFHDGTNWKYNDVKYWRRNSHYRFRAYCPYEAEVLPSTSDADNISIKYRIIDHQYDLLVAFAHRCPATDSEGYETVNMPFQHALSGLRFQVVFDESVSDGQTDRITGFHLKGLRSAGTLLYSYETGKPLNPELSWSAEYFDSTYEYYKWTGSTEFGKDTPANIFPDNNGVVCAIPQTIEEGKTSVHFTTANGAMDHTATLPEITWEPGKIYTYTLKVLKSSVEVNVGIKDWDEVQSSVEVYL